MMAPGCHRQDWGTCPCHSGEHPLVRWMCPACVSLTHSPSSPRAASHQVHAQQAALNRFPGLPPEGGLWASGPFCDIESRGE